MSEENLSDLLERAADRHEISSPPLDQMLFRSRRARKRRAGFMALAASVVIGSVIAGTTLLFDPSGSPSPAEPAPDAAINLEGEWRLTALNDADGNPLIDIRAGCTTCVPPAGRGYSGPEQMLRSVSMKFDDTEMTADLSCKGFGADYHQSGEHGDRLTFDNFRPMGDAECGQTLLQDRLENVRQVADSDGVVSLLAEDGSTIATLERVSTEPINLEGRWALTALTDADGKALLGPDFNNSTMHFEDGLVTGKAGCLEVSGTYQQSSNQMLVFSNIRRVDSDASMQPSFCAGPPLDSRLPDVRHVSEEDGKLQLHAENWMIIAVLERVSVEPAVGLQAPEFATYKSTGASDQALGSGTLTASKGCLVLTNGGHNRLIVFNDRTALDGETLHVVDAFGQTAEMKLGDRVSFGGGYGSALGGNGVTVPEVCSEAAKHAAFFAGAVDQ